MSKILTIAWKDIRIRFSSRSEILFFLVFPIAFSLLLGGTLFGQSEAGNRIPVLVINEDGTELADELLSALETSETVQVEVLPRSEAEAAFEDDEAPALLVIPTGFGSSLMNAEAVELDLQTAPNNLDATAAKQAILSAVGAVGRSLAVAGASLAEAERIQPLTSPAERQAYFSGSLAMAQSLFVSAPDRVQITQPPTAPEQSSSGFDPAGQASAGQLITWVFVPLLGTSEFFAAERALGTLRRLLTTPTSKSTFLLGTISGQLAAAIVQMILLVGFGIWVMGLAWGRAPVALAVLLLAFGLAAVAFGTMLGTFVKTSSQAVGLSIMLGMSMALLGGCWYPLELFPQVAQTAMKVLPTAWAMQGLSDLIMRGQGLAQILPEAGVLLGFAAIFFAVGVRRFRYE